jgi:hypothetical protein
VAFADLAKKHATFIAGHALGESIDYRAGTGATWSRFVAKVSRRPVDPVGEVLRNTILVFVSKENVAEPGKGKDQVRVVADIEPGAQPEIYTVAQVTEYAGGWRLECNKK